MRPSLPQTPSTASRMTPATTSGFETIAKCDAPSISVTVEPARSYEKRCSSGAIGWSAVPNTPQDGFVRQAAAAACSSNAEATSGRCACAMNAATSSGTSAQKMSWKRSGSTDSSTLPSGSGRGWRKFPIASDGKRACRSVIDSPASGMNALDVHERGDLVRAPATVITQPAYEWPTRTTGPSSCSMTASR